MVCGGISAGPNAGHGVNDPSFQPDSASDVVALKAQVAALMRDNAALRQAAQEALAQADRYFQLWWHLSHGVLPEAQRLPSAQTRDEQTDAGCCL